MKWIIALCCLRASGYQLVLKRQVPTQAYFDLACQELVKDCQRKNYHTEQKIQDECDRQENKFQRCDFFGEALSLATSHKAFDGHAFCLNFYNAIFCSHTMDKVLSSLPISDISYGECLRDREDADRQYCLKFQRMLEFAIKNEDLDTMRACYMIEAYSDLGAETGPMAPQRNETHPLNQERILAGSHKELASMDKAVVKDQVAEEEKASPPAKAAIPILPAAHKELNTFGPTRPEAAPAAPLPSETAEPKKEEEKEEAKERIVAEPDYRKDKKKEKPSEPQGDHVPIFGNVHEKSSIITAPKDKDGKDYHGFLSTFVK